MKKKLLLALTLLLSGVGMKAQSVSAGQMDERFNDNKLPYGWFTEGWEVDSTGVAKRKASSMDMENFNIADLLGGGGSSLNYLMTPPLSVQDGEVLSFSAKKGKSSDSGLGSFMGGGDSDSTLVVERAVYGEHMWIKVADFTTQLDSVYKTFTIANTEAGEYRFRFRGGSNVLIDSVAGFHVDNDAPDIYPVYQKKNIQPVDLGLCLEDTTMTFNIVNTATGTLTVNLSAEGAYTLDNSQVSVAAADTATVKLTFNYAQAHEGRNSTLLFFSTTDERVEDIPLPIDAVVPQKGVWEEDFSQNTLPVGWFTEGWEVKDSVATVKQSSDDGGMGGMFGGSSAKYYLMTPPLIVSDATDVLLFSVKKPGGGGMDFGSMMGGSSSPALVIEKSFYGFDKWERVKEFAEADTVFTTQWLSFVEPGEYRFRFVASDSIVIDCVAGFQIDMNAPDLYVKLDSTVVERLDFGTLRADSTSTFTVINTGTGTLELNVSSMDEQRLSVTPKNLSIAAGDSAAVNATMIRDESRPGEVSDMLLFIPDGQLAPQGVDFHAYIIKSDVWTEDFEPYYVVEDRTFPRRFPEGWTSTGWKLSDDNSNDMMAMFGGGGGEKSWGASSESDEYELITPRLQAAQGEVLRFDAEMGGMGGFMMMFGGGGSPTLLNVYYSLDSDGVWKYYGTYSQGGTIYFKAPYSGVYQLRFVGSSVTLDNFEGFHAPLQAVFLEDGKDEQNMEAIEENNLKKCNVKYNRVLSAIDNGDGTWTPDAYTIFLPYDMDFSAYNEPGKVELYRLEFIDRYYGEFVFTEVGDKASAGVPYLAVVLRDSVRLDAYDVKMTSQAINEDTLKVYDYEAWHTDDSYECIGQWSGSFVSCTPDDERAPLTYGLCDDGSWLKVSAAEEALPGFRAHFYASTDTLAEEFYMARARTGATVSRTIDAGKTYQTKFYQQGENGGSKDMPGLLFCGDITAAASSVTGVKPTIKTIDRDGTIRYFDLQGHQLEGKPAKGFYIENGKTHVAP